jgi:hypothetical protein
MKRKAFFSILCTLLFANVLVTAAAQDIEVLSAECDFGFQPDCIRLHDAIANLTDQDLLKKIAIKDKHWNVRQAAVENKNLIDQSLLAKIVCEDEDWNVIHSAIKKLTDQALLAKIAGETSSSAVRQDIIWKLTDQTLLAKIAIQDEDNIVRLVAVGKLTDQTLLAKIAIQDKDKNVQLVAVMGLTDQSLLAKIATQNKDIDVRLAAIGKLTDQALLVKIFEDKNDVFSVSAVIRTAAVAAMDASNPFIKGIAQLDVQAGLLKGSNEELSTSPEVSIARLKLAIQEPRIRARFPGILLSARVSAKQVGYSTGGFKGVSLLRGESISVSLSQGGETLAEKDWVSDFPRTMLPFNPDSDFEYARVRGDELLARLLRNAVFTQDDLSDLSLSEIPEVRSAAVSNLTNQTLLEKIAIEDKSEGVRKCAIGRLADQSLLAKIAIEDNHPYSDLGATAVKKLTDQALLAKIAIAGMKSYVREYAVEKLTDQELLAKIIAEDKDPGVRSAAKRRLDQIRNNSN